MSTLFDLIDPEPHPSPLVREWAAAVRVQTSADRVPLDFYETDPRVTRAFAAAIDPHLRCRRVLEPCAGDKAIAAVLRKEFGCYVTTNDIDPARKAHTALDASDPHIHRLHPAAEWWVSNPPFNVAIGIVANGVGRAHMAMLLRLSFMEPVEERREFLVANPPQHRIVTERISFRTSAKGSKTDSVTTEWVVWTKDRQPLAGVPPHGVLLWKHL